MRSSYELASAVDAFNKIFSDGFFEDWAGQNIFPSTFPPCDLKINKETKDCIVEFAVAGIPKELINLFVEGDYLKINIKKNEDEEENKYHFFQKRIKNSSISQKIYVPSSRYHLDKINVTLKDGILKVEIPAKEETKPKTLQIKYEA